MDIVNILLPPPKQGRAQRTVTADLRQRFNRIARVGGVTATTVVARGAESEEGAVCSRDMRYVIGPSLDALISGDMELAKSLALCPPAPELCKVWGVQLPQDFYAKRYPHARVFRQRME